MAAIPKQDWTVLPSSPPQASYISASQTPGGNTSLQRPLGKKTEDEDIVCLCRPPGGALTDGLEAATHPCHHLGPPRGSGRKEERDGGFLFIVCSSTCHKMSEGRLREETPACSVHWGRKQKLKTSSACAVPQGAL
ncbi:hypothetical protein ACOMHN_063771 [Nucella lapillus]